MQPTEIKHSQLSTGGEKGENEGSNPSLSSTEHPENTPAYAPDLNKQAGKSAPTVLSGLSPGENPGSAISGQRPHRGGAEEGTPSWQRSVLEALQPAFIAYRGSGDGSGDGWCGVMRSGETVGVFDLMAAAESVRVDDHGRFVVLSLDGVGVHVFTDPRALVDYVNPSAPIDESARPCAACCVCGDIVPAADVCTVGVCQWCSDNLVSSRAGDPVDEDMVLAVWAAARYAAEPGLLVKLAPKVARGPMGDALGEFEGVWQGLRAEAIDLDSLARLRTGAARALCDVLAAMLQATVRS